jgi:hypothetical protein
MFDRDSHRTYEDGEIRSVLRTIEQALPAELPWES